MAFSPVGYRLLAVIVACPSVSFVVTVPVLVTCTISELLLS